MRVGGLMLEGLMLGVGDLSGAGCGDTARGKGQRRIGRRFWAKSLAELISNYLVDLHVSYTLS
ncbi:hypothetical protein DXN05_13885 [Deminuibacter soli]|uniref:Uncharacterized protein n=1 Tax=Deminuibacter soli TaxID=2291815 RepID=A0A3E1NIM2_9BACT|nr:hypothetical protein DXN05_13885 [Deminuibacter soli]